MYVLIKYQTFLMQ